jgi:peptide/nickel transport system ATP-binding protein
MKRLNRLKGEHGTGASAVEPADKHSKNTTGLRVEGLRVELEGGAPIVDDIRLSVGSGSVLGLIGESGSGKTTTGLALLGYARHGTRITGGSVRIDERQVLSTDDGQLRHLRRQLASYVPQEPGSSLNPALRVGTLIREVLRARVPKQNDDHEVDRMLERVGLPTGREFRRRFVHQLSGGQQQRVAIAMALVGEPPLVVLDEPTTGLDVVTQAVILDEIGRLGRELGVTMVYISHDLAVVSELADTIAVMYAGRVVEEGPSQTLLYTPSHPYTRGLVAAVPDHSVPRRVRGIPGVAAGVRERSVGCAFAPRCSQVVDQCSISMPELAEIGPGHCVRCFEWRRTPVVTPEPPISATQFDKTIPLLELRDLVAAYGAKRSMVIAADHVSFSVGHGESVALVGESGSGKTTIARCVVGLHVATSGEILLDGEVVASRAQDRSKDVRRRIQIVFQNPNDSLNPDHSVLSAIARPARILRGLSKVGAKHEAQNLLDRVRLPTSLGTRYPRDISGGERQRVAIARALAARPDVLLCDEITSALDVSVQAAVIELLAELRLELGLAMLFISHDLGVVAAVADRAVILESGVVREQGDVRQVLSQPGHEYTRRLVAAAPRLDPSRPEPVIGVRR